MPRAAISRFIGSARRRRGVEQAGHFGRFSLRRSWCFRCHYGSLGIPRGVLPRCLTSGFLSRFGSGGLRSFLHLCFGPLERVPQFEVAGDEVEQRLGEFFVELLDGAGHADRSRQSVVFTIGGLLWNNVHSKPVVIDVAYGEQNSTMPH